MNYGTAAIYPGIMFSLALVGFFALLWKWRTWYIATDDDALARRSVWAVVGACLLWFSLWLTCGRVAMHIDLLKWAIPATTLLGIAALLKAAASADNSERTA